MPRWEILNTRLGSLSSPPKSNQISMFLSVKHARIPRDRPYVWSMSAISLDGRIASAEETDTNGGASVASAGGELSTETDRALLEHGWAAADAVLTTGATLRSEPRICYVPAQRARAPICVILSSQANLDFGHPVFRAQPTLLFTTRAGRDRVGDALANHAHKTFVCEEEGTEKVDIARMLQTMRHQMSIQYLDVSSGGKLLAELLRLQVIDEMRLTLTTAVSV